MTDLPEPMTPPECDLRGYDFMPLLGHRLFNSEFYLLASAEGFRAGVRLWWAAWQQCPAGSLPDDDTLLCRLADVGRNRKGWRKIRHEALHGFIKCSDGRLYHKIISELALDAWTRRARDRERKALYRAKKDSDVPRDTTGTGRGQDADVPVERTGQDRTGHKERTPQPPSADGGEDLKICGSEDTPSTSSHRRGMRAQGTNPRAIAEAERAAAPPPPEPDHPLWPALKARGVKAHEFRTWIAPLAQTETPAGEASFAAPSQFHAAQVRANFAIPLAAATGRRVVVTVAS
jgi:hypothetical protein